MNFPQLGGRELTHPTHSRTRLLQQGTMSQERLLPGFYDIEIPQLRSRTPLKKLMVSQLVRKSNTFTETKGFTKFSQKPDTCAYPEPVESSPRSHIHFLTSI